MDAPTDEDKSGKENSGVVGQIVGPVMALVLILVTVVATIAVLVWYAR